VQINADTVAWISGGSNGIGRCAAQRLLKQGARVTIADVDAKTGQETLKELQKLAGSPDRVIFHQVDVRDNQQLTNSIQNTIKTFGDLTIVFNNAGISDRTLLADAIQSDDMPKDWNAVIDIDLTAVINGTRIAIGEFNKLAQKKNLKPSSENEIGVIINTASLGGLHPMPNSIIYCAAKHGVIGFTRSLKNLRSLGIRVNALCPSFTETNMVREGMTKSASYRKQMDIFQKSVGPLLHVDDIVDAFELLVKDRSFAGAAVSVSQELGTTRHLVVPMSEKPEMLNIVLNRTGQSKSKL